MNNVRIYVEKKDGYQLEAKALIHDLNENLHFNLKSLRVLNIYDVFNIDSDTLEIAKKTVFSEVVTDVVFEDLDLIDQKYLSVEYLPGQYDQRADSAMQCIRLINAHANTTVKSGKLILFEDTVTNEQINQIKKYYINTIESREKDLSVLSNNENINVNEVLTYDGFIQWNKDQLIEFLTNKGLAMTLEDLIHIQEYFKNEEDRNPTETEIAMLDTYWSDHCRHTTFETVLENVEIVDSKVNQIIQKTWNEYLSMREYVHGNKKPITLMDLATIYGKHERKSGNLDQLEISDEINACSVYMDVTINDQEEPWLLMFKNETHNHPTEIEPYGGASTCVGGAIRDPLSGRSYVYQAMRISGAGNILEDLNDTLPNKLPQRTISKGAADGYSSYGNQIGLATTYVKELYHPNYVAKHLEVGAVVGAAPVSHIVRLHPTVGDQIILIGGRTGRDGIGGATGSSKEHTDHSIETSSAEVQKGNAIEERKIQRLFRNDQVTTLIKKSNDFGAGGVSVAIGELADSLFIDLNKVPLKYKGLNGTEIAISESQERMAVVVAKKDVETFIKYANAENLEATVVAEVTNTNRLVMTWNNQTIVNLSRDFINTNGCRQTTSVEIPSISLEHLFNGKEHSKETFLNNLKDLNVTSQKGMQEMFDASIGSTTVLMPYSGTYQLTPTQASVQKIPVQNKLTTTTSILSYGYNPYITTQSPFHGAAYAVVESVAKIVAVGGNYQNIYFTFQEYFERLGKNPTKWGKVTSALLGALYAQSGFNRCAIGGKDSMSGTFKEIDVPPTLISFAIATQDIEHIITPHFKQENNYIYYVKHNPMNDYIPNIEQLKNNYEFINKGITNKTIVSAYAIEFGGIAAALSKMSFGEKLGFTVETNENLYETNYGSILIESTNELQYTDAVLIGKVTSNEVIVNGIEFTKEELLSSWQDTLENIYPSKIDTHKENLPIIDFQSNKEFISESPIDEVNVFIPVFPGTNCEYDSERAFVNAGANTTTWVFRNQTEEDIHNSVDEMVEHINNTNILMLSGGFSSGDEPDGSAKFIVNVLQNEKIKEAVNNLLKRDGLILGICNGFQALVKSGLLPNGEIGNVTEHSPTLTKNDINRHVSTMVTTRVTSNHSPWLQGLEVGTLHQIPISHGEGKFVCTKETLDELIINGQIAFQYTNHEGIPTMNGEYNPNGSTFAIEGITSKCGRILGKMGHSERYDGTNFINIPGNKQQDLFVNGVNYFKNK